MLTAPDPTVAVVAARQDDLHAEALSSALVAAGSEVVRCRVPGVPGTSQADAPLELPPVGTIVVVHSAWLEASGWGFSGQARAALDRIVVHRADASPILSALSTCRTQPFDATTGELQPAEAPYRSRAAEVSVERARLFALTWLERHAEPAGREVTAALTKLRDVEPLLDGRHLLVERVANGPLAALWHGFDAGASGSPAVAVKVLHPQWIDTPSHAAFLRDDSPSHPSLAPVVASGGGPSGPFVVRPWGDNTLSDRIASGDLELGEVLQAILDAGSGLRALHEAGRRHGAIKPANVVFIEGRGVLADGGGPGISGADPTDVLFLAPETQEPGREPGPAADLYALAMTTLNALHGAPLPFWVLRDPERLLTELDVPSGIRTAIRKALDWDPESRTASVDGFESDLLEDESVVRMLCERASSSGRHEAVAVYLERLMAVGDGRSPSLLLALGRAQLAAGEVEAARESFTGAVDSPVRSEALAAARGLADVAAELGGVDARIATLTTHADGLVPFGVELLVDAAELQDPSTARTMWETILDRHLEKSQAERALAVLFDLAKVREEWSDVFRLGALRYGFVDDPTGAAAMELGRIAMDRLADPPRALTWLQVASDAGAQADDLHQRLEAIRSSRGEWRQVVTLMLERAEAKVDEEEAVELMLRAARVALYAHNHHDDAASIMLRVLLRDPEHRHALRFLARYHARALRDDRALALYARLAPHEERGREGEPREVRVADNVDYARLLLRNDRPRGAQLCLEAALDLNPGHIPTLALASQLSFDLGKWEEARVATRGLVGAYSSAEADATFCAALRRLGNLAWLHGDLVEASRHYNRVLELAPEDIESWWGRAKIALAGNAGRVDQDMLDEAPWLTAAPVRITPHEALARLLAGVLSRASVERWMGLDPMGREMAALLSAQSDLVLMSAVVDLMTVRQLIRGALFRRLREARPAWERAIKVVEALFFSPLSRQTFPVAESYRWCRQPRDFDPRHHRGAQRLSADPEGPVVVRPSLSTLHHASAWTSLLRWTGPLPEPPPAEEIEVGEGSPSSHSAVLILFPDSPERTGMGGPARRVLRVSDGDVIGAAMDEVSLPLATLEPEHLRFEAVGDFFYVRALGPLSIDGEPVTHRRLLGGERLEIGTVAARFDVLDPDLDGLLAHRNHLDSRVVAARSSLDEPYVHRPKAALFYTAGADERMLPLVGERVGVYEDVEGALAMERGSTDAEVLILQRQGEFYLRSAADGATRLIEHLERFDVGSRTIEFRLLDQLRVDDPTARLDSRDPILVFDDGSPHGRPVVLDKPRFSLGRGRDADFQIASDASLSRVHCTFIRQGDEIFLEDAGSSNGTLLNADLVEGLVPLTSGDLVSLGQTTLTFLRPEVNAPSPGDTLHDLLSDDPTDVMPVRARARRGLPVDAGLDKLRVVNQVLRAVVRALDKAEGAGRGQAFLHNLVAARPRAYQGLLDDLVVEDCLPPMEVLYNLAQRPEQEQRPLLNFVLGDLIDRGTDAAADVLDDDAMDALLSVLAETRYRDHLRF